MALLSSISHPFSLVQTTLPSATSTPPELTYSFNASLAGSSGLIAKGAKINLYLFRFSSVN